MESRICATPECGRSLAGRPTRARYCSSRCRQRNLRGSGPIPVIRVCASEHCSADISARGAQARYCSISCSLKNRRPRPPKECIGCGSPLTSTHGGARYCAPSCANSAWQKAHRDKCRDSLSKRRAIQRDAFVERVYRSVVWRRDKGICHICSTPANPNTWELDHIVPLVPRPGNPRGEHSYANTAVSHRACNRTKGNKPWPGGKAVASP